METPSFPSFFNSFLDSGEFPQEAKGSSEEAITFFQVSLAEIVWNALVVFEQCSLSLEDVRSVLEMLAGESVHERPASNTDSFQVEQVKRLALGAKRLITSIADNTFSLDIDFAKSLHDIVGREEALRWGVLRDGDVRVSGTEHTPPSANDLESIAEEGFSFLQSGVDNPTMRATATFLFMAWSQFFYDCNKRTAFLMMHGVLLKAGLSRIVISHNRAQEFNAALQMFYDTGEVSKLLELLIGKPMWN